MRKGNRRRTDIVWCLLAALLIAILAQVAAPLFSTWEYTLLDWHLRQTPAKRNEEKLVLILGGDTSMIALNSWPWPREVHAELIEERLGAARVVAYDVFLVDQTDEAQDARLAEAIAGHGSVVLGNAYRSDGVLLEPLEAFRRHAAARGYFNFYPDEDYVVRRYTVAQQAQGAGYREIVPSFVFSVLEAAGYAPVIDAGNHLRLLESGQDIALDAGLRVFKLPVPEDAYPVYEFADVLAGRVDPAVFEDAIVFVGISATGATDIVHTSTGYLTGTRTLADVCYTLISGGLPQQPGAVWQGLLALLVLAPVFLLIQWLPGRFNWIPLLLAVPLVILGAHLLFRFAGVYFLAAPLCTLLLVCGVLQLFGLRIVREGRERQEMLMNMIACFVSALDAKDPITAGHSMRVSEVAAQLAVKKGLRKKDVEHVRLAGLIHDIGKIGIADAVLNKPGKFTDEEFAEMKRHPGKGAAIMAQAQLPPEIIAGILDHHERPDGRGYPAGKTEEELHLFADIIKIADVYDALSSKRQYKDAWPMEKVCTVLYEGRGSEFNAELIDLFLADIQPGWTPDVREEA